MTHDAEKDAPPTCRRCGHLAQHHWQPEEPVRPTTACLICMCATAPAKYPCDWTADYVTSVTPPALTEETA